MVQLSIYCWFNAFKRNSKSRAKKLTHRTKANRCHLPDGMFPLRSLWSSWNVRNIFEHHIELVVEHRNMTKIALIILLRNLISKKQNFSVFPRRSSSKPEPIIKIEFASSSATLFKHVSLFHVVFSRSGRQSLPYKYDSLAFGFMASSHRKSNKQNSQQRSSGCSEIDNKGERVFFCFAWSDLEKCAYHFPWKPVGNREWDRERRENTKNEFVLSKNGKNVDFMMKQL